MKTTCLRYYVFTESSVQSTEEFAKEKTRFMSVCRKVIVLILRLPNMTNNLQLELKNEFHIYFSFQ